MASCYWGNRGHCPVCGRFVGGIEAMARDTGLAYVYGKCKRHGYVDITSQDWSWEDFFNEGDGMSV